eukprot:SAG11_NODE_27033_length_337_cov_21.231092_1_plen_49_part_01
MLHWELHSRISDAAGAGCARRAAVVGDGATRLDRQHAAGNYLARIQAKN